MHVTSELYAPVPGTIVADLSWLMYRNYFAMRGLGVVLQDGQSVPTGHIHGALTDIGMLALMAPRVILAVDSDSDRKEIYPEYKGNRNKSDIYPIKTHLPVILAAASEIPNVSFVKREGYEADDLINSIVNFGHDPILYASDNDLFQLNEPFKVAKNYEGGKLVYEDMPKYLQEKYGLENLSHLPIWYKTVRGDSSDNIRPGCPRYPSKKLVQLCQDLATTSKWEDFTKYIEERKELKLNDTIDSLFLNWQLVRPRLLTLEGPPLPLKKLHDPDIGMVLFNFQLMSVISLYQTMFHINFF